MKKKGFTLMELMGVVVVLSILFIVLMPKILNAVDSAKIAGIEYNAELLNNTITSRYIALYNKLDTETEIIDRIHADLNTNPEITKMTNPYNKSMKGVGLIKGETFIDTNNAAYIFTEIPNKTTIPVGVVYTVIKDQKIASTYSGNDADISLQSMLPLIYGGIVPEDITEIPGGGWETGTGGTGGGTGDSGTTKPPAEGSGSNTDSGISDSAIDRYFAKQLALELSNYTTYKGDWVAAASSAGATGLVFSNYIGTAFEPYKYLETIEDVFNNAGAMELVAKSTKSVDAILYSSVSKDALMLSRTALTAMLNVQYPANIMLRYGTSISSFYTVFQTSELAADIIVNSREAMKVIAAMDTYVGYVSSELYTSKFVDSTVAMEELVKCNPSISTYITSRTMGLKVMSSKIALDVIFENKPGSVIIPSSIAYSAANNNFVIDYILTSPNGMKGFYTFNKYIQEDYYENSYFVDKVVNSERFMSALISGASMSTAFSIEPMSSSIIKSEIAMDAVLKSESAMTAMLSATISILNLAKSTVIDIRDTKYAPILNRITSEWYLMNVLVKNSSLITTNMMEAIQPYASNIYNAFLANNNSTYPSYSMTTTTYYGNNAGAITTGTNSIMLITSTNAAMSIHSNNQNYLVATTSAAYNPTPNYVGVVIGDIKITTASGYCKITRFTYK